MLTPDQKFVNRFMAAFPNDVIAFAAVMCNSGTYGIGVSVLGQEGYYPTEKRNFASYEDASAYADIANDLTGLPEKVTTFIIADSMRRSNIKRDRERGLINVKMTEADMRNLLDAIDYPRHADEVDDIADQIAEILFDIDTEAAA